MQTLRMFEEFASLDSRGGTSLILKARLTLECQQIFLDIFGSNHFTPYEALQVIRTRSGFQNIYEDDVKEVLVLLLRYQIIRERDGEYYFDGLPMSDRAQRVVEKLDFSSGLINPGSSAETYAKKVVNAQWYQDNLSFDLINLAGRIKGAGEEIIVDISAGTGGASEFLLKELRRQGKRIRRLVLTEIDMGLARSYMQYAMKLLEDYKDVVDEMEFYILKQQDDGSFAPVSAIESLQADYVIFENAIHLVPLVYRAEVFQGIFEVMKPGAILVMGSGNIEGSDRPTNTVRVDDLFGLVRQRALEIIETDPRYGQLKERIARIGVKEKDRIERMIHQVFPVPPNTNEILRPLEGIGFQPEVLPTQTILERGDYLPFIIGIDSYVRAAVLPELGAKEGPDVALRQEIVARAYEEVYDARPEGFKMWWSRFTAVKPDPAMAGEKEDIGGIDMNEIEFERDGEGVNVQFDPEMTAPFLDNLQIDGLVPSEIDGFKPVTINFEFLPSILPLLGLEPRKPQEEFEVSGVK